jgi:Ca2+-binding EF-hand superfamily protein
MLSIPENTITREDFISFYDDCNINFRNNDVFNRYVSCQWYYTVEKLEVAKEEEVKAGSKLFRAWLIQKTQGTKDEYLIGKLFEEFELTQNYSIALHAFDTMIKKLSLVITSKIVESLFTKIDANQSQFIEYEEFKKYLAIDPYPI